MNILCFLLLVGTLKLWNHHLPKSYGHQFYGLPYILLLVNSHFWTLRAHYLLKKFVTHCRSFSIGFFCIFFALASIIEGFYLIHFEHCFDFAVFRNDINHLFESFHLSFSSHRTVLCNLA